ncbi:MAG: hypothetical protein KDC98_23595 [Planctomycetes bacterium]|nr:hypothetical protein [Planctomycetota bacterium]
MVDALPGNVIASGLSSKLETVLKILRTNKPADKVEKATTALKQYEKHLGEAQATMQAKNVELSQEIDGISYVPDAVDDDFKKLTRTCRSRAAELKDLAKDKKRGELHGNVGKLIRLRDGLNDDVTDIEAFKKSVVAAIDAENAALIDDFEAEQTKKFNKAGVALWFLTDQIKDRRRTLKGKSRAKVESSLQKLEPILETHRETQLMNAAVRALVSASDYKTLNPRKLRETIDAAIKNGDDVAQAKSALDAALDAQRKPTKDKWARYLDMTGYQVAGVSDKYDGIPVHVTYDQNSWSNDAKQGRIDVSSSSADAIMEEMFGAVSWSYQLHATLEITAEDGKHPHVYWGGRTNHWDVEGKGGRDGEWARKGREKLQSVLDAAKAKILAKIKQVKAADGDI